MLEEVKQGLILVWCFLDGNNCVNRKVRIVMPCYPYFYWTGNFPFTFSQITYGSGGLVPFHSNGLWLSYLHTLYINVG